MHTRAVFQYTTPNNQCSVSKLTHLSRRVGRATGEETLVPKQHNPFFINSLLISSVANSDITTET